MRNQDLIENINIKKAKLDSLQPLSPDFTKNFYEWVKIELTYTSNAIEGNTLSRAETARIVEKGITVEGKSLQEHQEAINHAEAFNWLLAKRDLSQKDITLDFILELHKKILQKIDDSNAGRLRSVPVRIAGSTIILSNPTKVPTLMEEFINWVQNAEGHPVNIAIETHLKLVSIHPFVDENGKTARLLMNFLLIINGFPPTIIQKEKRHEYISGIEKAQLEGTTNDYYKFMYESVENSLDTYLEGLEDN